MKKKHKKNKFSNLFKKLKKTNKIFKYLYLLILITYLISIIFFSYSLLLLNQIETLLRIILIIILIINIIIYLFLGLILLILKKHILLTILLILTTLFTGINIFGYYYIDKTYKIVDNTSKEYIIYTTNLISLSKEIDIKTIGLINNEENIEGYILPQEYMANKGFKAKIKEYNNINELLQALYSKEVDAIFIESNYSLKYNNIYPNISTETYIIDTYSKEMKNQDTVASTNKTVTEPFTVLLLGVDSEYDGLSNNASFNGDSIMLITFNPKTLSTTMFSIPRDTYVPIACNNNINNKINSAAAYGTKCMIETIQNLTTINIDYYVKINFKGVVSLVDSLDGITLNIDKPDYKMNAGINCGDKICEQDSNRRFGNNLIYITPGENQTLNGEQALAYSRNRHQFAASDFKRIEHQQAVVSAIINKTKTIRNVNQFYKVLNAISNNIDTNMQPNEILNFYNVAKNILLNNNFDDNNFINIQKTYLSGYDLNVYQNGYSMYTFQYYEESLNEIIKAMKENLELETPTLIKEFTFSANKEYKQTIIGKNFSGQKKNETLPNFINNNINYLKEWSTSRNIKIIEEEYISNDCTNDTITEQNIHSGTLTSSINELKVKVCKNIVASEEPIEDVEE